MRHKVQRIIAFAAIITCNLLASPVFAGGANIVSFAPATEAIVSPERGFWRFIANDFATATEQDLNALYDEGLTLGYGVVRLDQYRTSELPEEFLAQLESRFVAARKTGIKVILRFAYNYPSSSSDYDNAKDASLDIVLKHIEQLAPLFQKHSDVIAAFQTGFIGAWGEGHTSSNKLDSEENKAIIRGALLAAVPPEVPLQWRYPTDLIAWQKAETLGRFGFHNDCFLSSPTDVGTYDEDEHPRAQQRKLMAALTDKHFHTIETCDADKTQLRDDCASILREGAEFHVSGINREYYRAFHERWEKDGCMPEITDKMGYRLRLVEAKVADGNFEVTIANDGWARLARPRQLELRYGKEVVPLGDLQQIGAGRVMTFKIAFSNKQNSNPICLAAPDPNASLHDNARYAVRFANSNKPEQTWREGAFCFKTN